MRQIIESTDALLTAFTKTNENFTELYDAATLNYYFGSGVWLSQSLTMGRCISNVNFELDGEGMRYAVDVLSVNANTTVTGVALDIGTTAFFYSPPTFASAVITGAELICNSITCNDASVTLQHFRTSGSIDMYGSFNFQQLDIGSGGMTLGAAEGGVHGASLTAAAVNWQGGAWTIESGTQLTLGPMAAGGGMLSWAASGTVDSIPMAGGVVEITGDEAGLTIGYLGTNVATLGGHLTTPRVDTTGSLTASGNVQVGEAREATTTPITLSGSAQCDTAYGAGIVLSGNARIGNFWGGAQRADSTVADNAVVTGTVQFGGGLTWTSSSEDGPERIVATGDFAEPSTIDYAGGKADVVINAANADITVRTDVAKVTITEGGSLTITDGGHVDEIDLGNGSLYLLEGTVGSGTCTAAFSDAAGTTPIAPPGVTVDAAYLYGPIVLGTETVLAPNALGIPPSLPDYMSYQPALLPEEAASESGGANVHIWKAAA